MIHTDAITLRRRRMRDADAIVTLYTYEHGKLSASLRSVLKTNSRFAGITQPFNRLNTVLYAKAEDQDIWTLTQAALEHQYETIQSNLVRMAYASCLAEWVESLSAEFESGHEVWNLLLHALDRWEEREPRMEDLFFYQWRLLIVAGLQPDVNQCLSCKKTDAESWRYAACKGGVYCDRCKQEGRTIGGTTIEAVRHMLQTTKFPTVRLTIAQRREMIHFLQLHLEYHAEIKLNSSAFFHQMEKILNEQMV